MGEVVNWFISSLGGIKVINSNEVKIFPKFVKVVDLCRASHKLPNGEVKVFWKRENEKINVFVETDGNVKYTVELSDKDACYVV